MSLKNLRKSIELMKECVTKAGTDSGANEELLQSTKEHLVKAEKEAKQLDVKDETDRLMAVDLATKAAKKLKKGKKK